MSYSLYHLRLHFIPLLAKALKGLFPTVELMGGGLSDHGFYYEFMLESVECDEYLLKSIDQRVRELLHEDVRVNYVEMMRDVSIDFLLHKKQKAKALIVQEKFSPGVMSFLQVDECLEPVVEEVEPLSAGELKHFELFDLISSLGDGVARVEGTAFFSNKDLKSFKKKRKDFKGFDHLTVASDMKIYEFNSLIGEGVWLPKGCEVLKKLLIVWREFCSANRIQEIKSGATTEEEFQQKIALACKALKLNEKAAFGEVFTLEDPLSPENYRGMWRLNKYLTDRQCVLVGWDEVDEVLNSSLQSIMKTVNILGSDCCWMLCSPATGPHTQKRQGNKPLSALRKALETRHISYKTESVEKDEVVGNRAYCLIPDGLGKLWKGPFVELTSNGRHQAVVCCSLFGSMERMIASILEHYKGELPFVLAPEQVRLVTMPSQSAYTTTVYQRLSSEGFRVGVDQTDQRLAVKIHAAEKEKVPFIAVIGEAECKSNSVTLRKSVANNKQRKVTINDLLDELHRENSEMSLFAFEAD